MNDNSYPKSPVDISKHHLLKQACEGDIIKYYTDKIGVINFFGGAFYCEWEDQTDDLLGTMIIEKMEIVGNIFQTSGLLK